MAIIVDKDGNVVTVENEPEEARAMFPNTRDFGVGDVLIDGTSIVNAEGDAKIPTASSTAKGVISVSGDGLGITSGGRLRVNSPQSTRIKEGTQLYQPIDIYHNHEGVFYGMAKAAGDTTQSESTNPVGNYTDDAKIAIQKMLGVYDPPFRLLKEVTGGSVSGNIYIDHDLDNNVLSLKEVVIIFDGVQASGTGSACIAINGDNQTISGNNVPFLALYNLYHASARNMAAHLSIKGGLFFGEYLVHAADAMAGTSIGSSLNAYGKIAADAITSICIGSINNYNFTSGTIKVMGR